MMTTPLGLEVIEPAYLALLRESDGPAWLKRVRNAGAERWRREGLPSKRDERWKYTSTSFLRDGAWIAGEVLLEDELPSRSMFANYRGRISGEVSFLNGVLVSPWTTPDIPGVQISSALESESEPRIDASSGSVFNALNASFLHDVVTIEIAAGARIQEPILLSQFALGSESLSEWTMACPRIVVRVGRGAEAAIVEFFAGEGRYIHAPIIEVEIAPGARLSHARVSVESESAVHFGGTRLILARDSFCETYQFSLAGRLLREDLEVRLTEPGAEAVLDGLYVTSGRRQTDHSTVVEHVAPQTLSSQLYKGVLAEESRAVFNGRVHIHRGAQQSNASQLNNNLLLSQKAEVDTKPELDIEADDVKASHGATIGQIDPEHVFYLQTRSIAKNEAMRMLSHGFAEDVAFRIRNPSMREGMTAVVEAALASQEFEGVEGDA